MNKQILCGALLIAVSQGLSAEERFQFTMAEKYDSSPQPWYDCHGKKTADQIAQDICTVQMPDGQKRLLTFVNDLKSSVEGGNCGYSTFQGACFGMPGIAINRRREFVIGENGVDAPCYTNPETYASQFCTVKGGGAGNQTFPFTVHQVSTHSGNRCGYTKYEVICREPFPADVGLTDR